MKIQTGKTARPQKCVIYGPEGVGKTTLAAAFPSPLFIDCERGTDHLDLARLRATTYAELLESFLVAGKSEYQTVVIDTADWAEKHLLSEVLARGDKKSVEDFGYGKGYTLLGEAFGRFLGALDGLLAKGKSVVLLAHSITKKHELPEAAGAFDRYELKLSKQSSPLLKEWADMVLFLNFETKIAKDGDKARAVGGKDRVLHCSHSAAWDAKNRHGLADKLTAKWESIAHCFPVETPSQPAPEAAAQAVAGISSNNQLADWELVEQLLGDVAQINDAIAYLVSKNQLQKGQTLKDLTQEAAVKILKNAEIFFKSVQKFAADNQL